MTKFAIFLLFVLIIGGCASDKVVIGDPESVQMKGFKNNKLQFSLVLPVDNQRRRAFDIVVVDLDLRVHGSYLGKVTNIDTLTIAPGQSQRYNLQLQLQIKNLLAGASLLSQSGKVDINSFEMEGFIKVKSGLITKKIKVKHP